MKLAVKLRFEALLVALRLKSLSLAERSWSQSTNAEKEEHGR